jgi:membrane fusion protein, multidrug efflux system
MKPLSFNEPPGTTAPLIGKPPGSRRSIFWIVALIVLAIIVWGLFKIFAKNDKAAPPPPPVQVTLAPVEQKDFAVFVAGTGNVMPNQSVTVKARVDGQLQTLGYKEGQDVKAGQLIAQLDPRPLQAQLAQVVAQKGRDTATLANARLDLKRYEDLIKDEATSQQTLDTQKALVAQLEAAIKTDDAQVNFAKTQLDYTTITAPISGRTGLRLVDVGNIVHATDTTGLVVIDQIDPISVVFTLPDAAFQQVNAAMRGSTQPLTVLAFSRGADNGNDKPLARGHLVLVDNHIDTTSGTVQIKAEFENASHVLWPGQYVNVRLFIENRSQAILIPAAGVQRSQKGTYAYVIDGEQKAQMQTIHVVLIQDGQAVIDQGLKSGQQVVVDGQYKVKPGVKVTTASADAKPGSAGPGAAAASSGDAAASTSNPAEKSAPENKK